MKLTRVFYNRDAHVVARELLGKILVRRTPEGLVKGRIVEVEVYKGTEDSEDRACHAFPMKRTGRTEILFGESGHAYIYLIYGMYCCLNIVCNEKEVPECVLVRALEPLEGIPLMQKRRKQENLYPLCSGPGKLCQALALTRKENGLDLCGEELYVETDPPHEGGLGEKRCDIGNLGSTMDGAPIAASKRINISYAEAAADFLWRYTLKGNKFLSVKEK